MAECNNSTLEVGQCPRIRFSGFTNPWEQRKLGDITESYSGGTPTAGKKEYYDGNIPFIRSGEISGDKTELFISDEGLTSSSAKMVKTGDILYALYGATSGEVSISKLNGAINQAILAIQPHQNYDSQFLMQWLRKSKEYIIGTYLQGGQGNLSGNIVKELIIDVPKYEEQKEIGAYLKNIDNLITLHQRKCDSLVACKNSLLQKLFPKDGKLVPEIRFKGFEGEWELFKIKELTHNYDLRTSFENEYPVLSSTVQGIFLQKDYFNQEVYVSSNIGYKIVPYNFLTYRAMSDNSTFKFNIQNIIENGMISPAYPVFIEKKELIDKHFLIYFMNDSSSFKRQLIKIKEGGTRYALPFKKLGDMNIFLPSLEEQQKIGLFFKSLDDQINLQKQNLELLKKYKKGLLENMFV